MNKRKSKRAKKAPVKAVKKLVKKATKKRKINPVKPGYYLVAFWKNHIGYHTGISFNTDKSKAIIYPNIEIVRKLARDIQRSPARFRALRINSVGIYSTTEPITVPK